jgi:hypothetical protein
LLRPHVGQAAITVVLFAGPLLGNPTGPAPHRSRQLRPPRPGHAVTGLTQERIKREPVLGGLINEYERAAQTPKSRPAAES